MHSGYTLYPGIPHPHPPTPLLVPVLGFPGTSVLPTGSNFHEGQHPDTLVVDTGTRTRYTVPGVIQCLFPSYHNLSVSDTEYLVFYRVFSGNWATGGFTPE